MPDIGPMEIILVLAIALLVLGPSKLPEIGKSLGSSIREFRKAATDVQESVRLDSPAQQPAAPAASAAPVQAATAPVQASPAAAAPAQASPAAVSAPAQPQSAGSNEPQVGA